MHSQPASAATAAIASRPSTVAGPPVGSAANSGNLGSRPWLVASAEIRVWSPTPKPGPVR